MGNVRTVSNQNKPLSDRNRRRKSEPFKDYTGRIILLIFAAMALSIILTSCQQKKEIDNYQNVKWEKTSKGLPFSYYNIAVSTIGDTAFVELRENNDEPQKWRIEREQYIRPCEVLRDVANTGFGKRQNGLHGKEPGRKATKFGNSYTQFGQFSQFPITQPTLCNGNDGLSTRLDGITFPKWRNESIKAGGNAIVPQVAFEIFKAIEKINNLYK